MPQTLNEWVVLCNGEEFFLTDNQHQALIDNQDKRFVAFSKFTINPAFVSWMKQRPAEIIQVYYPCENCDTNGYLIGQKNEDGTWKECPECKGTGMDAK